MKPELDTRLDYYGTLGVSPDAPQDEIKRAYRKLARQTHPDTGADGTVFKAVAIAYEVLSDPQKRQTYDLMGGVSTSSGRSTPDHSTSGPEAETVVINGVSVRVTYDEFWFRGEYRAVVGILEEDLMKIDELPEFAAPLSRVIVFGEAGDELYRGYSLEAVQRQFERRRREEAQRKQKEASEKKLAMYKRRLEELKKKDLPTTRLAMLINEAHGKARVGIYWLDPDTSEVVHAFRAINKELERLSGDPADVIRDYFLGGKISHRDIEHNQKLVARLEELAIRTNGFVDVPTDETIKHHYEACLHGVKTLSDLELLDLRLRLEDYAPRDIVESLDELDPAPAKIELRARKGTSLYDISYGYEQVDGKLEAVGVVRIPLSTFEKNAPEHGKKSNFPELPYGIQLVVEVTPNGDLSRVIATGLATLELTKKVEKFARAQGRGKLYGSTDAFGFKRTAPMQGTEVPPWFRGRTPRAR